jgi:hypothetical protein
MKAISFWVPATICAFISMVAFLGSLVRESSASAMGKWWRLLFYALLPMCFFIVGSIMCRMHREIARLRHRVGRLEHQPPAGTEHEMPHPIRTDAKAHALPRERV